MARRNQPGAPSSSKDVPAPPTITEGTQAPITASETDIDIDIDLDLFPSEGTTDLAPPPDLENKMSPSYEEDLLDYEDDELVPSNTNNILAATESADNSINVQADGAEQENSLEAEESLEHAENAQATAEVHHEHAKLGMAWGAQTMLTQSPDMAGALQLNDIGDTVSVNITANGVIYEVTWKVTSFVDPEDTEAYPSTTTTTNSAPAVKRTNSLRDAPPLSSSLPTAPHASIKCKFGRCCKNGTACPFDHTVKPKLCGFVNTAQGCTNATACEFSHENEGVKCKRSTLRTACANGRGCAFKHGDDFVKGVKVEEKVEVKREVAKDAAPLAAPTGPKEVKVEGAPKGPKGDGTKQIAGQKRGRGDDDEVGNAPKGPRLAQDGRGGRQHRGRGRGQGRGVGRGRGGVGGGQGLRIRGAASAGQH